MRGFRFSLVGAVMAAALLPMAVHAHEYRVGDVEIGHPWAKATAGQAVNGAAYLTLADKGSAADRLLSAQTPAAEKAELHTHLMEDGVMKMRRIDGVDLPAGGALVEFKPGGLHIMLLGLKAPLKEGDKVPLTLTFEKAGTVTVDIAVQGLTVAQPEHHQGH